jgi:multicomponent Na+:H+ antiporter subunit B
MTDRLRLAIFVVAGPVFFALYCYATLNLPPWGQYRGPYGDMIAKLAVFERHATDTVNAINYDYRGFDTLGEEFILFTAVIGVMMLLRREKDVQPFPPAR